MKIRSLILTTALAMAFAVPAMAQQSMHRYIEFFKYSDAARVKAMTENPQDRAVQAEKIAESVGGKMEAVYWFPPGSEYDGMIILALPENVIAEGESLFVRFSKTQSLPAMTAEEFKAAMEKAKNVKSR